LIIFIIDYYFASLIRWNKHY